MTPMAAIIASRYMSRLAKKQQVKRKDTGRVVWVSPDTLRDNPQEYEPLKGKEPKKDKRHPQPDLLSLGDMGKMWKGERAKKKQKKKRLEVQPQETPEGAYKEIKRVRQEENRQHKGYGRPLTRDVETRALMEKMDQAEKAINSEIDRVLKRDKAPDLPALKGKLTDLRKVFFPLGGHVTPSGRRLKKMIKLVDGVGGGKTAVDQYALYQVAQQMMRELFPGKFEGAEPDVRHEQVRKLVERHQNGQDKGRGKG